jgi:hypothetical protein
MSANPIYDALEDEFIKALESGARPPKAFKIEIDPLSYKWLISLGLLGQDKKRIDHSHKYLGFQIAGYSIYVVPDDSGPEGHGPCN